MLVILALALLCGLLYAWLRGWWFARLLAVLLLAPLAFVAVGSLADAGGASRTLAIACGLVAVPLAWPLSNLPVYWRRHQSRALDRRVARVMGVLAARFPALPEKH